MRGLTRLGAKLHLSEGLLGLLTALGADAPELCSAVIAVLAGSRAVGIGVVVGSNLFNLAALLGLSALVTGRIHMRREPLLLDAAVGLLVILVGAGLLWGPLPPVAAAGLALLVLAVYAAGLSLRPGRVHALALPGALKRALTVTAADTAYEAEHDRPAAARSWWPVVVLPLAITAVVAGSFGMVHAALGLAKGWGVPEVITGTLVLASLTSLPNAYAAVHLGRLGRGTALMSEAMNSNTLNLVGGLAIPAAILGLGQVPPGAAPAYAWMLGLTVLVVALATWHRRIGRASALVVIGAYATFVALVLAGVF